MSSDQQLLSVLRSLNYDADTIRAMTDAAKAAELKKIQASQSDRSQLLTIQAAAAQSPRHAAQLRKLDNTIYYASGGTWRLPKTGHVDRMEVDRHIKAASITTRAAIKSDLYNLKLISA